MENIKKYTDFLNEDGEGGGASCGTGMVTAAQNGMGNIVSPQVGTVSGSLWQAGSGTIGSGDRPAYDMKNRFGWKGDKFDKKKGKKEKNKKPRVISKFSDWITGPKN